MSEKDHIIDTEETEVEKVSDVEVEETKNCLLYTSRCV